MSPEIHQLVGDVIAMTGAPTPQWLEADAPLLTADALEMREGDFYLIGLIGGKDVGKSALVNALVGNSITEQTSYGPGTETVIAYAHRRQVAGLSTLLDRIAAGEYRIVEHENGALERQVLLDLPDIDSHFAAHIALTRRILRHLLFPIWVQSIEKYADRQPQEMLRQVAAGNAPENFLFCLNKSDQLEAAGNGAVEALREDYGGRVARLLSLGTPPRVWMVSAARPADFDLPALRTVLARQKSSLEVTTSRQRAGRQQDVHALAWIDGQDLPSRGARLNRLQETAEELVRDRIGMMLLDGVIPRMMDDPLHKASIIDDAMTRRCARWPILNVLHGFLSAVSGLILRNREPRARPIGAESAEALVDVHLAAGSGLTGGGAMGGAVGGMGGQSLAEAIQSTFAHLQQSQPGVSELFREWKLWEAMPADAAAAELRTSLSRSVESQRKRIAAELTAGGGGVARGIRWLLTVGAVFWFVIAQPLAWAYLRERHSGAWVDVAGRGGEPGVLGVFVNMLGIDYLMHILSFLLIYFIILWVVLRWDTRRRVEAAFAQWGAESADGPVRRTMLWMDELVGPIRVMRERVDGLVQRIAAAKKSGS